MSSDPTSAPGDRSGVFLSYARADRPRVAAIAKALEAAGLTVWWDALIDGGAAFAKTIEAALEKSDAVVVAWSATSVASDWVRDEAARGRDLKRLVPVSLDGTPPPLGFRQYHAIDLAAWRGNADAPEMASLLRGIAAVAGQEPAPFTAARPAPRVSRRALLAAGGGAAVLAAGGAAWFAGLFGGGGGASANSVAVLPFKNLSGDPAQAYFSDGLAEEVRATLARNARLQVAAPTSAGKFRDLQEDAVTIAGKLGVAYLLEGSVRRSGDVVRIAAELIDARTGFSRWSQSFDRKMTDIFAVQSEIAATVAGALDAQLAATDPARRGTGGTVNVAAYDAYLRGRGFFDLAGDEATYRSALAQFDAAIAADPQYAAAHAARSRTLAAIANQFAKADQLRTLYDAAVASAQRATTIAPELAEAHSALGYALCYGRLDVRGARTPFDRSRALGAGDADVLIRYATYCARAGRAGDASEAIARAAALDPLNPRVFRSTGSVAYAARRYAESIPPVRRALALNPKMGVAHSAIGDALLMLGRVREARDEYAAESNPLFKLPGLAIAERKLGDEPAARQALAALIADHGDNALYQQAQVHASWGDRGAALTALEKARSVGDAGLIYARNDPLLDPLRTDPRFSRLLESIGFD